MRRIGLDVKRAYKNIMQISSLKNLELEGIFTHFAESEVKNKSKVLINKKFYPVVGAITMDWLMVDLGEKHNVKIGDDVLLMGQQNGYSIGTDKLAKLTGTIPYEMVCAVADRVERVYLSRN